MSLLPKRRREGENPLVSFRNEMNRLFDNFWTGELWPERFGFAKTFPNVEVTETDTDVIVRAEVPGLEPGDLDISVADDVLTIQGEKKEEKEESEKGATVREVHYGSFSRSIRLPSGVDVDKVDAECRKGVCKITLPKVESQKTKKIEIKGEKPGGKK
jgi:HSP20 family protein